MKLLNIGFGNMAAAGRIVAVVASDSAPVKRMIQEARDAGQLVDGTAGRRTRAVIITDSDHIILTYLQSETLANRMTEESVIDDEEESDE